ncbi:hypothetical protein FPQ18DRAFT_311799 [Pyronema domesticum]|uniref:Phosphotransferase n=1 Tax=Pyronema omphalodes (strain CBS 100304) TaxID=1076935 RepID=U4LIY8_PYROM|nr:hypothetical protein FPQ18DRAFT_311799 [Pyronema domesticum]CCX12269.1 Similar to Hexokinase type 2; acc. no. Q9NFT7 [Pyronema omphalodes CBS 100304]
MVATAPEEFLVCRDNIEEIGANFAECFKKLAWDSKDQFITTPIHALPTGNETGTFLALDLGGTNLRVAVIQLLGSPSHGTLIIEQKRSEIPAHFKCASAEDLFSWVGDCINDVLNSYLENSAVTQKPSIMKMGVTFSFPCEQSSHSKAILMPMGKGFTFKRTRDLATLLLSHEYCIPVEIIAITNDSVATLLSVAYIHPGAAAGIIAGTGTNATCLVPASDLSESKQPKEGKAVLCNTEWSINGTLPPVEKYRTAADIALGNASEKPGFQPLEEMISGRYMREIVRLSMGEDIGPEYKEPYSLPGETCSSVEACTEWTEAAKFLPSGWNKEKVTRFMEIAKAVSERSAVLLAAATYGLMKFNGAVEKSKGGELVIGWTGSVLEKHCGYQKRYQQALDQLLGDEVKAVLVEAQEGGIVGAAVLAGMVMEGTT